MSDSKKKDSESPQQRAKDELRRTARALAAKARHAQELGTKIARLDTQLQKDAEQIGKLVKQYRQDRPDGFPDIPLSDLGQLAIDSRPAGAPDPSAPSDTPAAPTGTDGDTDTDTSTTSGSYTDYQLN